MKGDPEVSDLKMNGPSVSDAQVIDRASILPPEPLVPTQGLHQEVRLETFANSKCLREPLLIHRGVIVETVPAEPSSFNNSEIRMGIRVLNLN